MGKLSDEDRARRAARTSLHCSAEWHISGPRHWLALAVYGLALRVAKQDPATGKRRLYTSIRTLSDYFSVSTHTTQKTLRTPTDAGFLELEERGGLKSRM